MKEGKEPMSTNCFEDLKSIAKLVRASKGKEPISINCSQDLKPIAKFVRVSATNFVPKRGIKKKRNSAKLNSQRKRREGK